MTTKDHSLATDCRWLNPGENAEKRIGAGRKQADEAAAQRAASVEAAKREEEALIRAPEQNAIATADAKSQDAQLKRDEAARKLAQVDRADRADEI